MVAEVIAVGGGITGLATAHALAGAGVRVRLLERRALGAGANWPMCWTPTRAIAAGATCAWRASPPHPHTRPNPSPCTDRT